MRTAFMLIAVAVLATSFDRLVTTPSSSVAAGAALAQTGPLPTAAVNPGLGAPPPGGHLGDTPAGAAGGAGRAGGAVVAPADPAARLGTMNENRLAPGPGTVPNAVGAVPPAPAGAVPPPAAGALGAPPAGAVTAPAAPAAR